MEDESKHQAPKLIGREEVSMTATAFLEKLDEVRKEGGMKLWNRWTSPTPVKRPEKP